MNAISRRARPQAEPSATSGGSHAALLIDFDNITLGAQSDLAKELRQLINSEALGRHVIVQRAYADWRRYTGYLVPLTEASVELVSATAVGPNKKNATDIRLAIDAMELAFTRPEIGTFILLSGDSDFSSLVTKLKEWGKYVIGVGMKESASDTLIRVCHEYYSYSDLAGLTKAVDEVAEPGEPQDPWQLIGAAVRQMVQNRDVMRADRLKQVMQQLDPAFDERNAGYSRFSKFITDAGEKGLLSVRKMENGQLEVGPVDGRSEQTLGRSDARTSRDGRGSPATRDPRPSTEEGGEERSGRGRRRGRGRGRGREEGTEPQAEAPAREGRGASRVPRPSSAPQSDKLTLAAGFELLGTALKELPHPVAGEVLRLRMIANLGREDALLNADRFDRLLRQAHDAELVEVRKVGEGMFDVAPLGQTSGAPARYERAPQPASRSTETEAPAAPPAAVEVKHAITAPRGVGARRGSKTGMVKTAIPLVGVISLDDESDKAHKAGGADESSKKPSGRGRGRAKSSAEAQPKAEGEAKKPSRRRGGRGRGKKE